MKKVNLILSAVLVAGLTLFNACNPEPDTFTLVSLTAGDIDLAGVTSATDVPTDAVIKAKFSYDLDVATATKSNFEITITDDGSAVDYSLTSGGDSVMITPTDGWPEGSVLSIELKPAITGMNEVAYGGNSLTFQTAGIYVPQKDKQVLYLSFDDETVADEAGSHTVTTVGTMAYSADRHGNPGSAAAFDGTGNLVEIAENPDLISENITISFWFNTTLDDYNGQEGNDNPQTRFLCGLGVELGYFVELGRRSNDPTSEGYNEIFLKVATDHINIGNNAEAVPKATAWTEVNSQIGIGYSAGVSSGWSYGLPQLLGTNDPLNRTYISDLVMGSWSHFAMTVDAAAQTKTIYLNGTKMGTFQWIESGADWLFAGLSLKSENNDGTPIEALEGSLALGYIGSSTNTATGWGNYTTETEKESQMKFFKGDLDQFRIFSVPLTDAEIELLYNNEK